MSNTMFNRRSTQVDPAGGSESMRLMGGANRFFTLPNAKGLTEMTANDILHIPAFPFHIMVVSALTVMFIVLAVLQDPAGPLGIPHTGAPTGMPTASPTGS